MKQLLALLFILFTTAVLVWAEGKLNSMPFAVGRGIEFIENAGQYKYSDGRTAEDILYIANTPTGTVYVLKNGLR